MSFTIVNGADKGITFYAHADGAGNSFVVAPNGGVAPNCELPIDSLRITGSTTYFNRQGATNFIDGESYSAQFVKDGAIILYVRLNRAGHDPEYVKFE